MSLGAPRTFYPAETDPPTRPMAYPPRVALCQGLDPENVGRVTAAHFGRPITLFDHPSGDVGAYICFVGMDLGELH